MNRLMKFLKPSITCLTPWVSSSTMTPYQEQQDSWYLRTTLISLILASMVTVGDMPKWSMISSTRTQDIMLLSTTGCNAHRTIQVQKTILALIIVTYCTLEFKTLLQMITLKSLTNYLTALIDHLLAMMLRFLTRRMDNGMMWRMNICAQMKPKMKTLTLHIGFKIVK